MFGRKKGRGKLTPGGGGGGGGGAHAAQQAGAAKAPPPPPVPAGLPVPIGEFLPWLVVSTACYAAFLWLPGRVSGPRARVTLIGGNEFINVASHLHFCVWLWPLHDIVLRLLAILLFPPRRAAIYFPSMFMVDTNSAAAVAAIAPGDGGDVMMDNVATASSSSAGGGGGPVALIFRTLRSLLVHPAPGQPDTVPSDYKPTDFKTHGGVPRGSTYWGYRQVALLSYVVMFLIWMLATYIYQTRHVLAEEKIRNPERRQRKQSVEKKRAERRELLEKIRRGEVSESKITEAERANLAEDEFSDDDVDYDPYGRPVPTPPWVPVVSWMALWSLCFSGAFVWVQAMPLLMGQLFPVSICAVLAYCILCPQ